MKYKSLILIIISTMLFICASAQNDFASLNINGKVIGEATVEEKPAVINIDEATYRNAIKAVLSIKQSTVVSAYKRSIQITDENENEMYTTKESKSEPGFYNINFAALHQKHAEQKILKVFLLEDPVNEKMSIPSRKKLMVELHLK